MKTTADIRREAEAVAAAAAERISELTIEEDRIKAEIAELRVMTRRYLPHEKAAVGSPKRRTIRTSPRKRKGVSPRTLYIASQAIAEFPGDAFTVADIESIIQRNGNSLHGSSVRNAIDALREREIIRAAECRRVPNGRVPSQFYRVMNAGALEDIVGEL
jgi:hypothetical protein